MARKTKKQIDSEYAKAFSEMKNSSEASELLYDLLYALGCEEAAEALTDKTFEWEQASAQKEEPLYSPGGFEAEMESCARKGTEDGHVAADWLLCDLLRSLGYGDGIDVFEKMHKWYS